MREHATRVTPYPCACAFARVVGDRDPTHFPRVGIFDMVLLRGGFIVRHTLTGLHANIYNPDRDSLHAEADTCCHDWFEDPPPRAPQVEQAAPIPKRAWERLKSWRPRGLG